jgi:hypothetical protein
MITFVRSTCWAVLAGCAAFAASPCESLNSLKLADTTITLAETVAAGEFAAPKGVSGNFKNVPAFCRVAGTIKPSSDSDIRFEVWMPSAGWNGRFEGVGNGGFAGSINYTSLASEVANGGASASTDTGHVTTTASIDGSWALGHPEKLVDYGYRAIHETAVQGKAIVNAFYGERPKHSYFSSCSNGGRQALMEAQRFPADYDGIIAGAPANDFTHLMAEFVYNSQALLSDPASYIPASKMPAISAAALSACDVQDGVEDGLINDPSKCRFDTAKLLCSGAETKDCLTQPQIAALNKIYAGPEGLFPGFSPGGESGMLGWTGWIVGMAPTKSAQHSFGTQAFQNFVFDDPSWDYRTFQLGRDLKRAEEKAGKALNATSLNLKEFRDRGGKLILYHGWSDAAIPPTNAVNYYNGVREKMGPAKAETFVRLFMVPGMQHCGGGPGPNSFGEYPGPRGDAEHDIAAALERWVETGAAPGKIVATKFKSDLNPASGVVRTRPLCRYPEIAKYSGSGSIDDAANFSCTK